MQPSFLVNFKFSIAYFMLEKRRGSEAVFAKRERPIEVQKHIFEAVKKEGSKFGSP